MKILAITFIFLQCSQVVLLQAVGTTNSNKENVEIQNKFDQAEAQGISFLSQLLITADQSLNRQEDYQKIKEILTQICQFYVRNIRNSPELVQTLRQSQDKYFVQTIQNLQESLKQNKEISNLIGSDLVEFTQQILKRISQPSERFYSFFQKSDSSKSEDYKDYEVSDTLKGLVETGQRDKSEEERGYQLENEQQEEIDETLEAFNEALLLTLSVKVEANDLWYDLEDLIADYWSEDTQKAGEDCARYGGYLADNLYYIIIELDTDELQILGGDAKNIISEFKSGMDKYYEEWAEAEEEEDENEYGYFYLSQVGTKLLKKKESDSSTKDLIELLKDALYKIRIINSNANDVLYDIDRLIQKEWDGDYKEAAEDMFDDERESTDYIYMELARIDIDELKFLTSACSSFLNELFNELMQIYEDEVGSDYEENLFYFIQSNKKDNSSKQVYQEQGVQENEGNQLEDITDESQASNAEEESSDQDESEEDTDSDQDDTAYYLLSQKDDELEDQENSESSSQAESDETNEKAESGDGDLVDAVSVILNRIMQGDDTVNGAIETLDDYIEEQYDGDEEDAAQAMYSADAPACDLIYAWFAAYDMNEITFVTSDNIKILDDLKKGLDSVYSDRRNNKMNVTLSADDSVSEFLVALSYGMQFVSNSSKFADSVIQACEAYSEEAYDGDLEELAEKCYADDPARTQYVFAWYLRLDVDESLFLSDDSIDFLNSFQGELMNVFDEEEAEKYELLELSNSVKVQEQNIYEKQSLGEVSALQIEYLSQNLPIFVESKILKAETKIIENDNNFQSLLQHQINSANYSVLIDKEVIVNCRNLGRAIKKVLKASSGADQYLVRVLQNIKSDQKESLSHFVQKCYTYQKKRSK